MASSSQNFDQTVDLPSSELAATGSYSGDTPVNKPPDKQSSRRIGLILGSGPSMSDEAYDLLRSRLQLASLILGVGYAAFWIANILHLFQQTQAQNWTLVWSHLAVTIATLFIAWRLCARCKHMLRHLRWGELIVFGGSALFFAMYGWVQLKNSIADGYIAHIEGPWLLLIFIYALFIPNVWTRAAMVIIPIAIAPVIITLAAQLAYSELAEFVHAEMSLGGTTLSNTMEMALGATAAIWGVRTIRSLRVEAFQAKKLGHYQLKRQLGSGGMGEVYLAEHLMLKRPCALKLIRPEIADRDQNLVRFEREVQATAKLTHWNTVEIYDYGRTDDGTFYYVMEYLPGMNLEDVVRQHGAMQPERAVHLLTQVCEALAEAHCQGLVHRDIKPANIFAARRGGRSDVAKLLDFGLVRQSSVPDDVDLTRAGSITGSPLYLSPEQALGEEPDRRSDIYSLGAVAYFLLTGQPPFDDENAMRVIMAHARDTPISLHEVNPNVPDDLEQIVMRCLSKDRENRYCDVNQMRHELLACSAANQWSDDSSENWWQNYGCPKKRKLDEEVMELATA